MAKSSDKEKIFKAAKENNYIQRKPHKAISRVFNRNFRGQKGVA